MDQMMLLNSQRQNWNRLVLISFMIYGITLGNNKAVINKIEVLANDMVSIHCHTDASIDIQWHFNSIFNLVFAGGRLWSPHKERLRSEDDNAGSHVLIIPRVRGEDAGWYYCSEEETGRRINSTHLTVLYSNPACFSNMHPVGFVGPNTCNLKQENMIFNCVVSFNGTSPHLMWRSLNDNETLNSSICEDKPNRRNCSLILKSDPVYDGSIFICQTTASIDSNFNCSTDVVKIQYFESDPLKPLLMKKNVSDRVNCSARSNQRLQFKWTRLQGNQYVTFIEDQELLIPSPGFYQCVVKYRIGNAECVAYGSEVNVLNPSTIDCVTEPAVAAAITTAEASCIALAMLVVIGIVVIVVLVRRDGNKPCKEREKASAPEEKELNPKSKQSDGGGHN